MSPKANRRYLALTVHLNDIKLINQLACKRVWKEDLEEAGNTVLMLADLQRGLDGQEIGTVVWYGVYNSMNHTYRDFTLAEDDPFVGIRVNMYRLLSQIAGHWAKRLFTSKKTARPLDNVTNLAKEP
ncbi:MAG: hypothetical protein EOO38_17495 [Cytophagaceae bacterium]|nr:MAG: hypothetical protein EOO38_17495 [Cytophagaceae bacterium]